GGIFHFNSIDGTGGVDLDILSGGRVETSGNLDFTSDSNTVTISGEGSELHQDSGCFYFSGEGNRMLISAGGALNSGGVVIGGPEGSTNNIMTVRGENTLVSTEDINLSGEANRLLIDQGATVQAYWLGLYSGAALDVENGAFESQRLWMESGGVMALTAKADEPPVRITDTATLNGVLSVRLDGGVVPAKDDRFYLFCWSSQPGGTFTTLNLPELSFGLGWDTSALYTAGEISVTGTQDSDEDGMPDAWEIEYFGGDADPDDDPDHDGQSNLEEFIAGMDPTDPDSHFGVEDMVDSIGGMVIRWQSVSNRTYGVYWTGVLTNSLQLLQDGIDYPQNSYTDTLHQAESSGFYKIEVQLQ
ncbi:MAG: hypothetical protein MUC65_05560, partial [Pontiellaceae bacterium]|nr:hypothetical protein [Pontiellaceae bacterium]